MISPDHALLFWIVVSFVLTAAIQGHKAFTWAFLGAVFFLPANLPESYQIAGLPILAKDSVVTYGMLPATLLFRWQNLGLKNKWDLLLLAMVVCAVVTSLANGLALYDGLSTALSYLAQMVLVIYLMRVHLRTRDHVRYFLKSLYWLSVFYSVLLIWEWRMSPQLHTDLYGYFPHSFLQMARGSFFRPVVFIGHGLEVGYLYAVVVLLGYAFIRNRDPDIPPLTLLLPVVGLLCCMSLGPILVAFFGWMLFKVYERRPIGPVVTLVPFGVLLLCLHFCQDQSNFSFLVEFFNRISPDRAQSLDYRLSAFELYIKNIMNHPVFGHATWSRGRIEGLATDSSLLIYLLAFGAAFTLCLYAWYYSQLTSIRRKVNAHPEETAPDFVGVVLFGVFWLAILLNFLVEGTTLILVVICASYPGDLRPEPEKPETEEEKEEAPVRETVAAGEPRP